MKPIEIKYRRSAGRFAVVVILAFVAVSVAAMITLRSQAGADDATSSAILGYLAQAAEALGR